MFSEYDIESKSIIRQPTELETEIVISKEKVPSGQYLNLSIIYTPYRSKFHQHTSNTNVTNKYIQTILPIIFL